MTKELLATFLLLFLPFTAYLQVSDNDVEKMMNKRLPNVNDIHYSMVSAIPSLYQANKLDTIKAITNYYERQYGSELDVIFYKMIISIKDGTFKEEIGNASEVDEGMFNKLSDAQFYERNIMSDLWWYKHNCLTTYLNIYCYSRDVREAYSSYYNFLRELAKEQMAKPGLSPVEKWLLVYFSSPSDTLYAVLNRPEYNGTALQKAWNAYSKESASIYGWHFSMVSGAFAPMGNAAVLGTHPYFGFTIGGRVDKVMIDGDITFRFINTAQPYTIMLNNSLRTTDYYFGGYIALDGGYELWRKKKHEADIIGGVGYEGFDALPGANNSNNKNSNADNKTINSVNLNVGLAYKIQLHRRIRSQDVLQPYLGVQARYNLLWYDNKGGTDLTGNAVTIGLVYGGYHHKSLRHNIISAMPKVIH